MTKIRMQICPRYATHSHLPDHHLVIIATYGDKAILRDGLSERREEWVRSDTNSDNEIFRLIDGQPYVKLADIVQVKREGGVL